MYQGLSKEIMIAPKSIARPIVSSFVNTSPETILKKRQTKRKYADYVDHFAN
jgi:hypothetical protein